MAQDNIILVDENDREIGTGEKLEVHHQGQLHRALSVFIFNARGEMLLQKRAKSKYHSAGLWSNACCSHPGPGQDLKAEAQRRLKEEMGIEADLQEIGGLVYKTELGDLTENEYDHIFIGQFEGIPSPNKDEVEDWQWLSPEAIKQDIKKHPKKYTHWFKLILPKVLVVFKTRG